MKLANLILLLYIDRKQLSNSKFIDFSYYKFSRYLFLNQPRATIDLIDKVGL